MTENKDIKEKDQDEVAVKLSLVEEMEGTSSDFQKEYMQEEIDELPPIKSGEINIHGTYAFNVGGELEVKFYIRNGMIHGVNFEDVPLLLVDEKDTILAKQVFDLREIGDLPPMAARPCKVYFKPENIFEQSIPMRKWKIIFGAQLQTQVSRQLLIENLPEDLSVQDETAIENFLNELPAIERGEVSFSTFYVGPDQHKGVLVSLFVRNAADEEINIKQIPVTVRDGNGNLVASIVFDAEIKINAYSAQMCNFLIEKQFVNFVGVDLDSLVVTYEFQEMGTH